MFNVNKIILFLTTVIMSFLGFAQSAFADADGLRYKNATTQNAKSLKSKNYNDTIKLSEGRNRKPEPVDVTKLIQGNTAETQYINLSVNKAAVLRLPRPSRDVVVANPTLMDLVVRSPQEIYLFAKEPGHTNAFIFDEAGRQIVNLEINIGIDTKDLERIFNEQIPNSNVKITSMADTIILSGTVKSAAYAKMARDIAQRMVDSPEKVINNIGITGQEQVMIKVKVAEIQRTILKQLGVDWNTAFKFGQNVAGGFGLVNGFGANGPPATGLVGSALNTSNIVSGQIGGLPAFANTRAVESYLDGLVRARDKNVATIDSIFSEIAELQKAALEPAAEGGSPVGLTDDAKAYIAKLTDSSEPLYSAIDQQNSEILNIQNQLTNAVGLANGQPNLRQRSAGFTSKNVAVDGLLKALERHSLLKTLAEPNLTALSGESAKFLAGGELPYLVSQTFGQASVDFKPYGIGLAFTPVVLDNDRISLKVSTEISEISETVTAGNSSYPGLSVRRAETTVEMPSGGTMAMAGLIRDDTRRAIDTTPGIKDVPVLGPLFKSNDFKTQQSELVVLVTPYLAKPAHESEFGLPTDGFANPSDMDMYLKGRLNAVYDSTEGETGTDGIIDNIKNGIKDNYNSLVGNSDKATEVNNNSDEYIVE